MVMMLRQKSIITAGRQISTETKKTRQVRLNVKVVPTVFFDNLEVIHQEFLLRVQTINQWYYLEILRRLRENLRRKRSGIQKKNSWFLHHDNAMAHISLLIHDFCVKKNMTVLPHPPYFPALASAEFFLFPKLKSLLKSEDL